MGFEQTTFGEYAKVQGGNAYKSKDFIEISSNKVLKIKNVRFGTVNYNDSGYISDELAQATKAWQAKEGDILISMTGSGPNAPQSLVGRVARVWKDEPNAWINQRVGRIQLKNEGSIDPDFLFYLLSLPQSQEFLVSNSSGSANQANISGKIIELLPCPKVSYKQSAHIAEIARSLDKKIILNKQTNHTLEKMAQTLFKSWFVDFDPVFDNLLAKVDFKLENLASGFPEALLKRAQKRLLALDDKAKTALLSADLSSEEKSPVETSSEEASQTNIHQHFPSEFEHNEQLGWIPKGWEVSNVGSIAENVFSGGTPNTRKPEYWGGELKWFASGETRNNLILDTAKRITDEGVLNSSTKLSLPGDILIAGAGQGHTRGQTSLNAVETYFNQSVVCIRAEDKRFSNWLFENLHSRYEEMRALSDSHSIRGSLTTKLVSGMKVLVPNISLICFFDDNAKAYLEKNKMILEETATLTKLRDTILPKLISGELQIS